MHSVSRREFLTASAIAGGGFLLGWRVDAHQRFLEAAPPDRFAPNAFIRIDSDGRVTMIVGQVEMGQGVYTSIPMLLAEELEVGLDQVHVNAAPPSEKLYVNPLLGIQATGASTSIEALYLPMRRAGATARAMLVTAAAQTWNVDAASCRTQRGVVIHTPTGRTLSYGALAAKAATLPVPKDVALKNPRDFTLIGTPAKRLDSPMKVTGAAQFGIDVRVPGMKVAHVIASPVVGGKVASVDDRKAKAVKGVRQIVRLDDAVAVIADDTWAAVQGSSALEVRWNDGPNAAIEVDDVRRGLMAAADTQGVVARKQGDAASAMASAVTKHEASYECPFLAHATMEPMNCTVHVRPDSCEVWTGSQVLARAQATAAQVTGLPLDKVVVHNLLLGGGFGRRLEFDYVTQAVRIGKQVDGPVKVNWTREEDIRHDVFRPYYFDRLTAGLDVNGRPVAWTHRVVGPSIVARWLPPAFKNGIDNDAVDGAVQMPYDIPAIQVDWVRHEEPVLNTGWWRGVGVNNTAFAIESFIDELAVMAKRDPVAYRRALLAKSPRALAVLDLATRESGWGQPLPAGRARGVSVMFSRWNTYLAAVAELEVMGSGDMRVHRVVCAVDCGVVVNPDTVKAQLEGAIVFGIGGVLYGEVTLKNGRVEQSNFHDYRVLRINETPAIDVHLVRSTEAPGGIGEPGTALIGPALANAVFAATGKRVRKLPLVRNLRLA